MKVLLIDVDSKIPNLALMNISAYHKKKGDIVGFNIDEPDVVYISCVFTKNKEQALGIQYFYPDSKVYIGGSGVNYEWLPEPMQKIMPDYDLYPSEYSQGFTTRGCIRHCPFCIVPHKEGYLQRWMHIKEFHDDRFDTVMLMDNNILADKEWFFENTDYILENDLFLIENGMDIRLMDDEIAERLSMLKFKKPIKFAFDNMWDKDAVIRGIKILKKHNVNLRANVMFYVLVGYNTTPEQDKYRCRLLKKYGTNPYVMPYKVTPWTRRIKQWANSKELFWSTDIDEYKPGVGE